MDEHCSQSSNAGSAERDSIPKQNYSDTLRLIVCEIVRAALNCICQAAMLGLNPWIGEPTPQGPNNPYASGYE